MHPRPKSLLDTNSSRGLSDRLVKQFSQHKHLPKCHDYNESGLANGPVLNSLTKILSNLSADPFLEAVVVLVVYD